MLQKTLSIFLLLIFLQKVQSQDFWTLEQCIEYAYTHNAQILQAENNTMFFEQNVIQSKGSRQPSINGFATHNYNFGRNIDPFTNQFTNQRVQSNNYGISGNMILYNGFQNTNTIRQNQMDYTASTYDAQQIKENIALNITQAYLQVLYSIDLKNKITNQLALSKEQQVRVHKLIQSGILTENSLLEIDAQIASEEMQLIDAENQLDLAYLNLKLLMQYEESTEFKVQVPSPASIERELPYKSEEDVFNTAVQNQPSLLANDYKKQSALYAVKAAAGRYSPTLTLNGSISTLYSSSAQRLNGYTINGTRVIGYTLASDSVYAPNVQGVFEKKPYFTQLSDNFNRFIGVTLSVPITNKMNTKTNIQKARINMRNAEYQYVIEKNNLKRKVLIAYQDANASLKRLNASQKLVHARQAAFHNTEKRFELGLVNSFEYNQSKNNLLISETDLLQAQYDYMFKSSLLKYYAGQPIKL